MNGLSVTAFSSVDQTVTLLKKQQKETLIILMCCLGPEAGELNDVTYGRKGGSRV
jgi:hypothetical protein